MSGERYWFEEVPEEERYWFLAPVGVPKSMEERREAEARAIGLNPQEAEQLRAVESDLRHARVFGKTEDKARKLREEVEEVDRRVRAAGYGDVALSVPWWPEALYWEHRNGPEYVQAPILYTDRERAKEEERRLEENEPQGYLQLVEQYGEERTNEVLDNSAPYKALWVERASLLDKLQDSVFLCVMVDGVLKLRHDFMEELAKEA